MPEKGSNFERDMCKGMSLWISHGTRVDVFMRNRVRVTEATPNRERQLSDLTSNVIEGIYYTSLFVTECKTGYSKTRKGKRTKNIPWDLLDLIDSPKRDSNKVLLNFWDQVYTDAQLCGKYPLLLFKRDFHVECACVDVRSRNLIYDYCGSDKHIPHLCYSDLEMLDKWQTKHLYIYRLEDFLNWFNPDIIETMHKERMKK